MLIEINPHNIDFRLIDQAVAYLKNGGLLIYPTDTVYAMGCDLKSKKGLEALAKYKGEKLSKTKFSIICKDMSEISTYVKQLDRPTFKLLKSNLPGAFTFILNATQEVQRVFDTKRSEIGIRIPDNNILHALLEKLGNGLVTTSLHNEEDTILDYFNDPYTIYEKFDEKVEMIIDGGYGSLEGSTVIDCTAGDAQIVRQGLGILRE
jgi:tRNA threonylcarbamoyl adenosine modification protein (Sua5/YciO/YrdC/YwlC family)